LFRSLQTVESKDIFYAREMEQENNHSNGNESHAAHSAPESLPKQLRRLSTTDDSEDGKEVIKISAGSFDEEDDEEVSETAKPLTPEPIEPEPVLCCEDEEDAHLYLRLPAKKQVGCQDDKDDESQQQKEQETHRHVDGQCALCIDDYEAGDQVVWSDLECPHAFHKECIMQWLSKGKKRCPVCRNWFVPGARIDDQKKLHGEDWERAAAAMQHQEEEQIVPDAIDLEHGNNPAAIDIEQQSESPEIAPSTTEESDNDDGTTPATSIDNNSNQHHEHFCGLQCPSYTLGLRSTSETSELDTLQRKQQSPAQQKHTTSSTRLVVDTIEECTLSENNHTATNAAITDDCCRAENPMDISAETEEAVSRRSSFEEV
jgi:Ring finger domain